MVQNVRVVVNHECMTTVFHVARRPRNHLGLLDPSVPSHPANMVLGKLPGTPACTYPGIADAVLRRYPDGVTSHGMQYLAQWPNENPSGAATEAVFEAIRLAECPLKPSRMTSCFASETVEDARTFIAEHCGNAHADIWRAEAEITHRGNMGLLKAYGLPVVAALERASTYWRGERGPAPATWEVLTAPGMRLIELVETTGLPTLPRS